MPWKVVGGYSGNPKASTKDAVRFKSGDTDNEDLLCGDAEISAIIEDTDSDLVEAAARVCEHIAARFAREADKVISSPGGVSTTIRLSSRATAYLKLASQLRQSAVDAAATASQVAAYNASGYAGGISVSDKQDNTDNTDNVQPAFTQGMFDDHGTTDTDERIS